MHWSFAVFLMSVLLAPSVVGSEPSVTCWDYGMEVSFEMSLFPSLDVYRLHLLYPYCTATNTSTHTSLFTNLSSCGTTYVETGDSLIFSNVVQQDAEPANGSANDGSGLITREHDFELPFECSYSRKTLLTLQFVPEGRIEIPGAVGFGNLTFTFDVYKSSSYVTPYEDYEYPVEMVLGEYMYLEYSVLSTADLVIMAENCKATKGASFYSSPHYTIIENGCSRDTTLVHDYDEYRSYQRFWIKGFRFFNDYDSFYLHCELVACHANSTSRCHQGCLSGSKRKRREVQEKIGSTSDTYVIKRGPLRLIEDKKEAGDTGKQSAAVIGGAAAAGGVALVAVIALAVLFVKYRIARLLLNRNKIGDMYATEEEQAGRQNAYIQEDDMIKKSDAM